MSEHEPRDYLKLQVRLPRQSAFVLDDPENGVLDRARLGGETQSINQFVLDESLLDATLLAREGDDPNSEWTDVISFTQQISITRGAKATETGSELETGVFTVRLIGAELDPHQNLSIVPGVDMRLITIMEEPVFMGRIRRVNTTYDRDDRVVVNISVQDGAYQLAQIMRYGVNDATFAERVDDLLTKHAIPYSRSGGSALLAQTDYASSLINHLQLAVNSEGGFFYVDREGVTQVHGVGTGYSPYDLTVRTNLHKNPGMRASFNYISGYEDQIWSQGGGREGRGAIQHNFDVATAPANSQFFTINSQSWSQGQSDYMVVTPGTVMTFSAYLATNVDAQPLYSWVAWYDASGSVISRSAFNGPVYSVNGDWVRSHITVTVPAGAAMAVYNMGVKQTYTQIDTTDALSWSAGDYFKAADILIEESAELGIWFDGDLLSSDTAIYAWVDSPNASESTQTYAVAKQDLLRFYSKDVDDPAVYYYKEIDYTYDSGNILNQLEVTNKQWDVDEGVDVKSTYEDATSIATWGPSNATMETNLADPAAVEEIANKVLENNREPVNTVRSLVWNATNHMEIAATLEPYAVIQVQFENRYFEELDYYRVLTIEHTIDRDTWMVTLTLDHYNEGI